MLSVPAQMVLAAVAVVWVAQVEQALVATARGHRQALTHQLANQAYELSSILQLIVSGSLARLSRISVSWCTFKFCACPGSSHWGVSRRPHLLLPVWCTAEML